MIKKTSYTFKKIVVVNVTEVMSQCLTRRQQAYSLAACGFSYEEIAKLMSISKKGVWMHITSRYAPSFEEIFICEKGIGN